MATDAFFPTRGLVDLIRAGPELRRLAILASQHEGFETEGGEFGLYYPHEIDGTGRPALAAGTILVRGHYGPPDGWSATIMETEYLEVLRSELLARGLSEEAALVTRLLRSLVSP